MSRKVLVADDETHILHVVSLKLRNAGYEVITAVDGEEALELALAEKPDLLVLDYQMPYLSGVEVCKRLRCEGTGRAVPAIMLTARGFDIEPREIAEGHLAAVLEKPFSPRELLQRINEILKCEPSAAQQG